MTSAPSAPPDARLRSAPMRRLLSEEARARQGAYVKHFNGCFWCQTGIGCREGDLLDRDANDAYGRLERAR